MRPSQQRNIRIFAHLNVLKNGTVNGLRFCVLLGGNVTNIEGCDCADVTGGEWRLKYERAIREIEFTKKRLQQEFDDKLEVEQQNKRQLDRRVSGGRPQCGVFQGRY